MFGVDEGEMLLARLNPGDRANLEALVDAFIAQELPAVGAGRIAYAADCFEAHAARYPEPQRRVVLSFAAALRERQCRTPRH